MARWAVASTWLVLASCSPQAATKLGAFVVGRYRLDGVAVSASPVDEARESIEPPILVDVFFDGSVRGVESGRRAQ